MAGSRYLGAILGLIVMLAAAPAADNTLDALRVVEVALSTLIVVVLTNTAILYRRRARASPGTTVLPGGEYVVMIVCIVALLGAATAVVVQRLEYGTGPRPTMLLLVCIGVQPALLWWAIRMERRLTEQTR